MNGLVKNIVQFLRDEAGPTAVEYAMLFLLVVLALLSVVTFIGQRTASRAQ